MLPETNNWVGALQYCLGSLRGSPGTPHRALHPGYSIDTIKVFNQVGSIKYSSTRYSSARHNNVRDSDVRDSDVGYTGAIENQSPF